MVYLIVPLFSFDVYLFRYDALVSKNEEKETALHLATLAEEKVFSKSKDLVSKRKGSLVRDL